VEGLTVWIKHRFNVLLAVVTLRFLVAGKKIAKKNTQMSICIVYLCIFVSETKRE